MEIVTNLFEQSVKTVLTSRISGPFLVAVSGGADSTALLAACAALREELGFQLFALHVDHGLRSIEESIADEASVSVHCRQLSVPLRCIRIERGLIQSQAQRSASGIEAAARLFRHKAFNDEADRIGASHILVGHTADDLLETTLMRFLKGSGPAGLASLPEGRGRILRPILSKTRSEVLEYLEYRSISYRTDQSNADPKYFRNKVRLLLVPLLDAQFPEWRTSVPSLSQIQKRAADFISNSATAKIVWAEDKKHPLVLSCNAEIFINQDEILQEEALFQALNRLDLLKDEYTNGVSDVGIIESVDHISERTRTIRRSVIFDAIAAFKCTDASFDLGGKRIQRKGDRITVELVGEEHAESGYTLFIESSGSYELGNLGIVVQEEAPLFTKSGQTTSHVIFNVQLPCVLRSIRKEDRIQKGAAYPKVRDLLHQAGGELDKEMIIAEDIHGIAAALAFSGEKNLVISIRNAGFGPMDYAQSVFFSIFLKRGNHA